MKPLKKSALALVCLFVALSANSSTSAQQKATKGEWRHYGGDLGSTKYSPLDQINKQNVGGLKVAWSWDSRPLPSQGS